MDPSEKRKLARKAIRKNPDAYGALITEYKEYLYKMAYLYMKNEQDALDIVGTTILKGFQNIHTLKNPDWFKTWITKILIRTAQDELKKVIYFDSADEIQISERYNGVSLEEKHDLYSAIDQLSERYQTVIVLKYFSGFSVREIAFVMNIPEGSVKAYLSRARSELKNILKEDYLYASHQPPVQLVV